MPKSEAVSNSVSAVHGSGLWGVTVVIGLLMAMLGASAHPANYVAKTCISPNKTSIIMGAAVLTGEDHVNLNCEEASSDEKSMTCSVSLNVASEVMVFVDSNNATLNLADMTCSSNDETSGDGHDHDHRQLAECTGVAACSSKVMYTSQKATSIANLKITGNDYKSGHLVVLSAAGYGQVKRSQFNLSKLPEEKDSEAKGTRQAWRHSFSALFLMLVCYLLADGIGDIAIDADYNM